MKKKYTREEMEERKKLEQIIQSDKNYTADEICEILSGDFMRKFNLFPLDYMEGAFWVDEVKRQLYGKRTAKNTKIRTTYKEIHGSIVDS